MTPDGTPYRGFKVTIGGIQDPAEIKRSYEDIERILKGNNHPYREYETKTDQGTFKSFVVES